MSVTNDGDTVTRLLQENEELKSALQAEKKRNNLRREVTDYINAFQECFQKIEEKMQQNSREIQEKLDSAGKENLKKFTELHKQISNVEDSISTLPQFYPQYVQHWLNSLPEKENV